MPADEGKVFVAIGLLQGQITDLSERFEALRLQVVTEQRTVHDIVVATNEAIRNIARTVERIEPFANEYRLKAASIDESIELAEDYREKRAEQRGEEKFKKWMYGLAATAGGLMAVVVDKLYDKFWPGTPPPHP